MRTLFIQRRPRRVVAGFLALVTPAIACSGDDGGRASASDSATATVSGTGLTTTAGSGSESVGESTSESASGGESESAGTTTTASTTDTATSSSSGDPTTDATTTIDPTTSGTTAVTITSGETDSTSTTGPNCDEMGGDDENALSVIWIANSGQGSVSKIDTKTGVELGRYMTRPDGAGSPSRTSVNRHGDVAVANRTGGVTTVIARPERCVDKNNDGMITTSSGANILPWGEDECISWHTPIAHGDNRPIAWTSGTFNEQTCEWEELHVWTAWSDVAPGTAVVALLDGATGAILQEVPIPDLPQPWPGWHGFYGAAVDAESNVWLSQLQGQNPSPSWLVRVNYGAFTYDAFPVPEEGGYGMTVTSEGFVWICGRSTRRFDPLTETWTSVPLVNGGVHTGGCMGDGKGILYRGSYAQIHGLDTNTLEVVKTLNVGQPGDDHIWGVAVDFDGKVWGVPRNSTRAYKVDPESGTIEITFEGLVSAYTYSDMTGFALFNVTPG